MKYEEKFKKQPRKYYENLKKKLICFKYYFKKVAIFEKI